MGYGWDGVARPMPQMHPVSQQNVYIRGLAPETTDLSLHDMCKEFGKISSAKAIPDKLSKSGKQCCRGYGFVLFQDPQAAALAVQVLTARGTEASFARESHRSPTYPPPQEDPTNLYFSNLPFGIEEAELEELLKPYGEVVSTKILRNDSGEGRGVGFARMTDRLVCIAIISKMHNVVLDGATEPLICKFADNPSHFRGSSHFPVPQMPMGMPYNGPGVPKFLPTGMPMAGRSSMRGPLLNTRQQPIMGNHFVPAGMMPVPTPGRGAGQSHPAFSTAGSGLIPVSQPQMIHGGGSLALGYPPQPDFYMGSFPPSQPFFSGGPQYYSGGVQPAKHMPVQVSPPPSTNGSIPVGMTVGMASAAVRPVSPTGVPAAGASPGMNGMFPG